MPLPLLVAGAIVVMIQAIRQAIMSWLAAIGLRALLRWGATALADAAIVYAAIAPDEYEEIKGEFEEAAIETAASVLGLNLAKKDPLSDASICNAISERTGVALRTLRDRDSIKQDVEHWAMAQLEARTGLYLSNIRDKAAVVRDLARWSSPIVADATGLPLTDISDVDKTKAEVMEYLQDRALVVLGQDVAKVKKLVDEALKAVGSGLDAMAVEIAERGGIDPATGEPRLKIDVDMIALGILARALLVADKRRRGVEAEQQKASRRKEQMRAAVKRFRERHGSRLTYEPIGG